MTRMLACLTLWMAMTAAWAQNGLTVDYTYRGAFSDQGARYEGACYVTPAFMRRVGWQVDVTDGVASVSAEGHTFQLESSIIGGKRLYCLDEAVRYLGGTVEWDEAQGRATVLGRLRNIEKTPAGLRVDCTMNVKPRAFRASGPPRMVLDLAGAVLDEKALAPLPSGWRASQFTSNTVRVVIESPTMSNVTVPALLEGRTVELALASNVPAAPKTAATVSLGKPAVGSEVNGTQPVVLPWTSRPSQSPTALYLDPTTIQVTVPGSAAEKPGENLVERSPFIRSIDVVDDGNGTCTVTLNLKSALAFELNTQSLGATVSLSRPKSRGGLAGKIIVVDAGHGGKDNGAVHAGVQEKNQTLAMAKTVAKALKEAGASVIMTRSDDTFVSLGERSNIANRSKADLFVSCHFNSNSVDNSRSGTIVFYHNAIPLHMLLAECIRSEIAKFKDLPDMGTWSDTRIYNSGFAVLRGAQMPAVLLELGFLNHATDRSKIQDQNFRDHVADAIVKGAKVFFGEESKK
ncbi:MAG: N-acetylmuramoyl-L-alanine amidase [Armatimonadetes bacterium]|nr:N-acetylmuramoyl-L-alanine amidase [Armatimonadota bacterium]